MKTRLNRKSEIVHRQSAMALVLTLILLSVTLVMAVAFLAISRRERNSVSTTTDTTTANLAADSALAQAEAQIVSGVLASMNPYVSPLVVSTNYISGFISGISSVTNVSYTYTNGAPLSLPNGDYFLNIANLYYLPRPPVYASNLVTHTYELQYYLDLNRNGTFEATGLVPNTNNLGNPLGTSSQQVGDPQWIGVLEHPDAPHGPNNPFIARYAFIAVPANSLDFNHIHNQVAQQANPSMTLGNDGYFRNQGVGTWEINLAAFLADLNTNIWDPQGSGNQYIYNRAFSGLANSGVSFFDAFDLLTNRYADNYNLLGTAENLYGFVGSTAFTSNGIDGYTEGPLQTNFDADYIPYYVLNSYALNDSWAGGVNTNNFFTPESLFNTNETANFGIHLLNAGVNVLVNGITGTTASTYDRYTFYRMLSQIGTDTAPQSGKIDLNYQNAVVTYNSDTNAGITVPVSIAVVPNMETNFIPWRPIDFFTAAADKMLHAYSQEWLEQSPSNYLVSYYGVVTNFNIISGIGLTNYPVFGMTNLLGFGITNIPVYINGKFVYTPAVNRLLQLAANIYDASTNRMDIALGVSNYPSVFRPIFWVTNQYSYAYNSYFTNVYVRGYQYYEYATNGYQDIMFSPPMEVTALPFGMSVSNNVWGVPWILGAKKGFPNLNQVEVENNFFIERELQFTRSSMAASRTYTTNQMYIVGVSNYFGASDWNSYEEPYAHSVTVRVRNYLSMGLTWSNQVGAAAGTSGSVANTIYGNTTNVISPWGARAAYMLQGTNQFIYQLTAGGLGLQNNSLGAAIPFLLNPQDINWSTNANYVLYFGPGSPTINGYTFPGPSFIPVALDPLNFLDSGTPPLPQINLLTTNRLQAYIIDNNNGAILDYVQLGGMDKFANINQNIADNTISGADTAGLWSTNGYQGGTMPFGVYEQYLVSKTGGAVPTEDNDGGGWANTPIPGAGTDTSPAAQQAFFSAFFSPTSEAAYGGTNLVNTNLTAQAPFTPTRVSVQRFLYTANDPLVHYMTSDLNDPGSVTNNLILDTPALSKLVAGSDRYSPWGTSGESWPGIALYDQNAYNLSYKDPLVTASDNWDFPTNKYPTVGWLGRVHRGTPWQTVFLKSTNLLELLPTNSPTITYANGLDTWQLWTGNPNLYDAAMAGPIQDRLLFDLFTAAPNDDATRGQLSVNIGADAPLNPLAGLASWSALLSGTIAFSNNLIHQVLTGPYYEQDPLSGFTAPHYAPVVIPPNGANSVMSEIVQNINSTRTNHVNADGLQGVFEHAGDVLSSSALSDGSPFLDLTYNGNLDPAQMKYGISDEMYEWLPQQVMGLLTVSGPPQAPPRYVVYCYGQTLKPAPNGIVTSGTYFGLCTNYQVVAQTGARAIIRLDNCPTPANPLATPHIVIEQYNPLPPD
jgi:hypothetical protein